MAETLFIPEQVGKKETYEALLPQIQALISGETDIIANLANVMACLKSSFPFLWVGVYLVKNDQLVLGPFQGPLACTRIHMGKGVCGKAWENKESVLVPDVNTFEGHIACSSESKSELVIPVFNKNKEVIMVLDVDSEELNYFDAIDKTYLEQLATIITKQHG